MDEGKEEGGVVVHSQTKDDHDADTRPAGRPGTIDHDSSYGAGPLGGPPVPSPLLHLAPPPRRSRLRPLPRRVQGLARHAAAGTAQRPVFAAAPAPVATGRIVASVRRRDGWPRRRPPLS
jgi:hypothetical protein